MESVTTYCQASYLLSGKLPTIRQATYCQASYLLSGRLSAVMKLAPNNRIHAPKRLRIHAPNDRIHAPNRSIDMHPKGIDMHPNVSIYFAPNNRIFSQVTLFSKKNLHVHILSKEACFD